MEGALLFSMALVWAGPSQARGLPADFPLSPVTWGGIGGPEAGHRGSCPELEHHPVILVHDDREGPEAWYRGAGGGIAGALREAGLGECEIWAIKLGEEGSPMGSIEELTDDLKFFISSVQRYTRANRVQLLGRGAGAVLTHATMRKYRLHPLVHTAIYLDAPFAGMADCDAHACFGGVLRCCTLRPGAPFLGLTLRPVETPERLESVPDEGFRGHLRYIAMGSTPPSPLAERSPSEGGWMLDGAANLYFPDLGRAPLHEVPEAWSVVVEALRDPASPCPPELDGDGDGFCPPEHGGLDCDDTDPTIYPGAEEVEADGVDQDCNGYDTDRRVGGWSTERPLAAAAVGSALPGDGGGRVSGGLAAALAGLVALVSAGLLLARRRALRQR